MVWLFLSVVLIAVVYLAIQFPAFRKAIWVCLALLSAGAGWLYYAKIEDDKRAEKRAEFSRRLIRPDEIVFTDLGLRHSFGWEVKGNVTNRSSHELSGFTLKVIVQCRTVLYLADAVRRSVKAMPQRTSLFRQTKCGPLSCT
jgi:hypothetical protein